MKSGIELIAEERQRQISKEGWTPKHDDAHKKGEMAGAAATYALHACGFIAPHCLELYRNEVTHKVILWPWGLSWWKPSTNPIRDLEKAGALLAAEIDRLRRQWQVFKINDWDWWMARSLTEAKAAALEYYDGDKTKISCEARQLMPDELRKHCYVVDDGGEQVGEVSFREELDNRIDAGPKVELFASTEI